MPGNRIQEIRECYQHAADCVQRAEAGNDPKVKKQFLELTRRWLLLARCYDLFGACTDPVDAFCVGRTVPI
jgi:hypothetical protein